MRRDLSKLKVIITGATGIASLNPQMIFIYVSGSLTDSSEKGRVMWARVKGKTENALMRLGFRKVYNFRPGLPAANTGTAQHQIVLQGHRLDVSALARAAPEPSKQHGDVGLAMINSVLKGYPKQILEIKNINSLVLA